MSLKNMIYFDCNPSVNFMKPFLSLETMQSKQQQKVKEENKKQTKSFSIKCVHQYDLFQLMDILIRDPESMQSILLFICNDYN